MIKNKGGVNMFQGEEMKHLELLELAQSFINCTVDEIAGKYPEIKNTLFFPRFYSLHFTNASITCVINILDVCDICFIEFETVADIAVCRYQCRTHYLQIGEDLWVNRDFFVQCTLGIIENGFRVSWRHDKVLGSQP